MRDGLVERCARERENSLSELESHIRGLFANPQILSGTYALAEVPIIGGKYIVDQVEFMLPTLLPRIVGALCSRERFRVDAPGWPSLPLRSEEIEALEDDNNPRLQLLGLYASSLAGEEWAYDLHPRFNTFCSGLMAYKHTPNHLRSDRELRREFPPRRLKGLCIELDWRNPERLAQDRHLAVLGAAYDARMASTSIAPQA
jgi:hypothetical protein